MTQYQTGIGTQRGHGSMPRMDDWEALLARVHAGEAGAREALFATAYPELRRLARSRLFEGGRNTVLDTTALVHESYLRMAHGSALQAGERRAFFAYASQVMRSVIVDAVRERQAQRRGGGLAHLTLDTGLGEQLGQTEPEVLHVHEALQQLALLEPRLAQIVEMRYFGGFSDPEIADALGLTDRTVRRDWAKARLMLLALLG
jgi:RNA polymerase sigma factor (TIGR02999 family)